MGETVSLRDKLRKAATSGKHRQFKKKIVKFNGEEFEVRQPSNAIRSQILAKSKIISRDQTEEIDIGAMQVWGVIQLTYVPGTDERVFEEADYETLANEPTGGIVDTLSPVITEFLNVESQVEAKNG